MLLTTEPAPVYPLGAFGPEACGDGGLLTRLLAQTLDHVGHGLLLLTTGARLLHANRQAHQTLDRPYPLFIDGTHLRARIGADSSLLSRALDAAIHRGLRQMLQLGVGDNKVTVAVLPLDGQGSGAAVVSLPLPRRSHDLAVRCLARQLGFTAAESSVLEALLAGDKPVAIARSKGVALSTVRTQIGRLRQKTGAHSIRELLEQMAALPPMMAVLQ